MQVLISAGPMSLIISYMRYDEQMKFQALSRHYYDKKMPLFMGIVHKKRFRLIRHPPMIPEEKESKVNMKKSPYTEGQPATITLQQAQRAQLKTFECR